jgi:hypothetical protein
MAASPKGSVSVLTELPLDPSLWWKPSDDHCHTPGDTRDWCETVWFSFMVPERGIGGWLYAQMRPNLGTLSGGAFVWAPGGLAPWEQPYYGYQFFEPLPENLDLTNVTFRNGVSVKCLAPGMSYDLGYRFRDSEEFVADLHFEGITPPVPHVRGAPPFVGGSSHYDQHGHVTGTIQLLGETIPVDCISIRDRSWGRRPEHIGRGKGRLSYAVGSVSADESFLVFCTPVGDDPLTEREQLSSGYLLRDGVFSRLAKAERLNECDPQTGAVATIRIEAVDELGRKLGLVGTAVSGIALPNSHLCVAATIRWDVNGRIGYGEDQDVWPFGLFADHIKQLRS